MPGTKTLDAFTQWQELSLSDEQYQAYEGRLKRILDEEATVIEAKLREEEAVFNSRKATAIVLLKNGVALDLVVEASQLTREQVVKIQQELQ